LVSGYSGLQHFSKNFDSLKGSTWQGIEICEMIRTLVVNCGPIPVCYKDDRKTGAESASDEMVMAVVRGFFEFSLLVNHKTTQMYPSTHMTMYLNNFPTRTVFFKNWKC
jgi:hypothetical protein